MCFVVQRNNRRSNLRVSTHLLVWAACVRCTELSVHYWRRFSLSFCYLLLRLLFSCKKYKSSSTKLIFRSCKWRNEWLSHASDIQRFRLDWWCVHYAWTNCTAVHWLRQVYKIKTKIVKLQTMSGQMDILFEPDQESVGSCSHCPALNEGHGKTTEVP
jgi:hypothetical protein